MEGDAPVRIPGFELKESLGHGAMGDVYLAHETALDRDVAIKVLKGDLSEEGDLRARFDREVRAAAKLRHRGVVPVLATGEADGHLWYTMEYVPGHSLDEVLKASDTGRIHRARAARMVAELARTLQRAHEAGVTHRDVKPGNILLLQRAVPATELESTSRRIRASWVTRAPGEQTPRKLERPLLTDFGLAMDTTASKLSHSGMLIGTPGYMAPEQFAGQRDAIGPAVDQWGLGVVLYECLTGRLPFPTDDLPTLARYVAEEDPIRPSRLDPRIDKDLETIALKCLEKDPRDRYASCSELADDLQAWLLEKPIGARPPGLIRRLKARARRHPIRAAAALSVVFVILVGLVALGVIGVRRQSRIAELDAAAKQAISDGDYAAAADLYGEWIGLDPGAAEPRDGRDRALALVRVEQAEDAFRQAVERIRTLRAENDRAAVLAEQHALGELAAGGTGLGVDAARGSEPWWMREPAYRAGLELRALEQRLVESRAQIAALLEVARSLIDSSYEVAGGRGREVRDWIYAGAAAWHMDQWRRAVDAGDEGRAAMHRLEVAALDPAPYEDELAGREWVRVAAVGPGAEGWLFRYAREADVIAHGGPRLLPVPFAEGKGAGRVPTAFQDAVDARTEGSGRRRVEPDVPSIPTQQASNALFVGTMAGPLRRTRYDALLASSAYPLETAAFNRVDLSEDQVLTLERGRYLLLVRSGAREARIPFEVSEPLTHRPKGALPPASPPKGFLWIPPGRTFAAPVDPAGDDGAPTWQEVEGFFASRYEVTFAEYWAFLNDTKTLAEIARHAESGLRFVPRYGGEPLSASHGAFFAPVDNPEHPAMYLSLFDIVGYLPDRDEDPTPREALLERLVEALARSETIGWGYLRWRTERSLANAKRANETGEVQPDVVAVANADGTTSYRAMRFTLPTAIEWERMARGADRRVFVYGDEREWTFFKGARSRAQYARPEAVGLFVDDESVFGVRDLAGSVSEWTADWRPRRGAFIVKGAAWSDVEPDVDRIEVRSTRDPGAIASTVGFRVIVRQLDPAD